MKRELIVGPVRAGKQPMGTALALQSPADFFQRGENRFALLAGHLLIRNGEGHAERRRRKLTMRDAVGNHLDCEALGIADRIVASLTVAHDARPFEGFRDPAPVFLPIEFDCQLHRFSIL
jgi:hypothetical protein